MIPLSERQNVKLSAYMKPGDLKLLKDITYLNKWDMYNLPRPYTHLGVTFVFFALTVALPALIYGFEMNGDFTATCVALGCVIAIKFVGYLGYFIYCYFWPDPYVWGPQQRNYKELGTLYRYADNATILAKHTEISQMRIKKTIGIILIFDLFPTAILAGIRFARPDVDWSWIAAAVILGFIIVIGLLVVLGLGIYSKKAEDDASVGYIKRAQEDEERQARYDDEIDQMKDDIDNDIDNGGDGGGDGDNGNDNDNVNGNDNDLSLSHRYTDKDVYNSLKSIHGRRNVTLKLHQKGVV